MLQIVIGLHKSDCSPIISQRFVNQLYFKPYVLVKKRSSYCWGPSNNTRPRNKPKGDTTKRNFTETERKQNRYTLHRIGLPSCTLDNSWLPDSTYFMKRHNVNATFCMLFFFWLCCWCENLRSVGFLTEEISASEILAKSRKTGGGTGDGPISSHLTSLQDEGVDEMKKEGGRDVLSTTPRKSAIAAERESSGVSGER